MTSKRETTTEETLLKTQPHSSPNLNEGDQKNYSRSTTRPAMSHALFLGIRYTKFERPDDEEAERKE